MTRQCKLEPVRQGPGHRKKLNIQQPTRNAQHPSERIQRMECHWAGHSPVARTWELDVRCHSLRSLLSLRSSLSPLRSGCWLLGVQFSPVHALTKCHSAHGIVTSGRSFPPWKLDLSVGCWILKSPGARIPLRTDSSERRVCAPTSWRPGRMSRRRPCRRSSGCASRSYARRAGRGRNRLSWSAPHC
jgi:hypothetical protein